MLAVLLTCVLLKTSVGRPVMNHVETRSNATIPTSNNDTAPTILSAWHAKPNERGTADLLISCFATLFFAAWTSYHPNIPTKGPMLWTRLKWVTLAAFAPEIILWTAFSQWWAARRLKIEVNKLGQTCHSSQQQTQATQHGINGVKHGLKAYQTWPGAGRHEPKETTRVTEFTPWTMKEAFFALSGGFAVKSSSFFPFDSVTFTAKGVLQLARAGMLPHMSRRDIEDKSKADWLAKGLACFQGVTFFGIMIGRWAQRLPVTLLEVHVLIHVICAFAMYLIWFEKGYDIQRPLYCDDERIVDLAAFFSLEPIFAQSHLGITEAIIYNGEECCTCDPRYNVTLGPVQCAHLYPMDNYATRRNFLCETFETLERADGIDHSRVREQVTRVNRAIALLRQNNAHICWLAHDSYSHLNVRNQGLECLVFPDGPFVATRSSNTIVEGALTRNDYAPSESEQAHSDSKTTCPHKVSSTSDAASASQVSITASKPGATQPAGANEGQPVHSTQTPDSGRSSESSSLPTVSVLGPEPETETIRSPRSSSESRTARSINLARVVGEPDTLKKFLRLDWVGLWLSCAAYGSAHLSAWNLYFPTAKEMWVWRGTALSLIAAPALAIPAVGLKMLSSRMEKHKEIHANTTNRAWRVVHRITGTVKWTSLSLLMIIGMVAMHYPVLRMVLLGEALAALRKPEMETYQDVNWGQYMPHFS